MSLTIFKGLLPALNEVRKVLLAVALDRRWAAGFVRGYVVQLGPIATIKLGSS